MSRVLGLDGGGTKTLVAVADRDGAVEVWAGPGLSPTAPGDWRGDLGALLAGRSEGVAAAVLGLPCHDEVAEFTAAQDAAARALIGPQARVLNDVQIAHVGAFAGGAGALVLAGTGSMAWAFAGAAHHRVGGWGERIGDEGSAWWIGARALNRLSHCLDGRAEDADFVAGLLQAMGVSADQVMDWAYAEADPRATVAGLARVVTALAGAGNASARAITDAAADHLAQHLAAAWAKTGRQDVPVWSYAGGVFQAGLMVQAVQDRVGRPPQPPALPPVGGALVQAALDAGWVVDAGWLARVAAGLQAGGG